MKRGLRDYYPIWIELMLIFLIFCSFYLVIKTYPALPDKIPTHYNARGVPDAWCQKSWLNLLLLPIVQTVFYIILTVAASVITWSENPVRFVNLPVRRARLRGLEEADLEELRKIAIRGLLTVKGVILAMFAYINQMTIKVALGIEKGLGYWMWVFIALIFIGVGWMTFRTYLVIWQSESTRK